MTHVCLIGNGDAEQNVFETVFDSNATLIAADGGARHLKKWGYIPHHIIGDLDSLEELDYWRLHTNVVHDANQDTTDLEKCLDVVDSPLYIAFGFGGDRFDHTVEMLHILHKYATKRIIFFVGNDIIFRLPLSVSWQLPLGTRISLYPLEESSGISSSGLTYPLNGITLKQGLRIGTSNSVCNPFVTITQQEPTLACIVPKEYFKIIRNSITQ